MTEVNSTMLPLGTRAPYFELATPQGKMVSLDNFKDANGLLVAFICNHCPYVKHIKDELINMGKEYQSKGLGIIAINSNDWNSYPEDRPEKMKGEGYPFPYVCDEEQKIAKEYRAACTPDFYLFDSNMKLVYRGQFDDSRPGNNISVTGKDLRRAIDALLKGEEISDDQRPSTGCNIKWKEENRPDYF